MKLTEILDSEAHVTWVENDPTTTVGYFLVDKALYGITLVTKTEAEYKYVYVSFGKYDGNGELSTDLTNFNKNYMKVLSTVANSSIEQLARMNVDAYVYVAIDHVDSRMSVYNKCLARIKPSSVVEIVKNVKDEHGNECTVLLTNKLSSDQRTAFKERIVDLAKHDGFDKLKKIKPPKVMQT